MSEDLPKLIKASLKELLLDPQFQIDLAESMRDMRLQALLLSRFTSADFFRRRTEFDGMPFYESRQQMYAAIISSYGLAKRQGLLLEFGVAAGDSIRALAANLPQFKLYGFDSFEGLPEAWYHEQPGAYSQGGKLPAVPANVELIKGWFEDTVPKFAEKHASALSRGIDVLHLDADIYSATKTALQHFGKYLKEGTIVLFDEYHGYYNWENHEHKAWGEFCNESGLQYRFIGVVPKGVQAAARVLYNPLFNNKPR